MGVMPNTAPACRQSLVTATYDQRDWRQKRAFDALITAKLEVVKMAGPAMEHRRRWAPQGRS